MVRWIVGAAIVASVILGWALRWEVVTPHTATADLSGTFFMVNRWTGEIRWVDGRGYITVHKVD